LEGLGVVKNTLMRDITLEDLIVAYRTVKVDCFYETGHITALSFAIYEKDLIKNLNFLLEKIHSIDYNYFESEAFVGKHYLTLKKVEFKKQSIEWEYETPNDCGTNVFHSNSERKWNSKKGFIPETDFRLIGQHPINFHILSSLWIDKVGKYLEKNVSENSYGCRLKNNNTKQIEENGFEIQTSKNRLGHFRAYLNDYQKWQTNGIEAISKSLDEGKKVLAVTTDLKKFYHRIDASFIQSSDFLDQLDEPIILDEYRDLTNILINAISAWSKNAYNDSIVPPDFKYSEHCGVPMGLGASKIIANLLLIYLDKEIKNQIKPIYYGRYVDDIFLVIEDGADIKTQTDFWNFLFNRIPSFKDISDINFRIKRSSFNYGYIPKGIVLNVPYSKSSLLEFSSDKGKYFFLEGSSGSSFLSALKDSLEENSSEWKLPPDTEHDIESYTEEVAKASSNYQESANGLRKSDGLSVQRLKFILYLTRLEKAVKYLPKSTWYKPVNDFFQLSIDYLLTPESFAVYTKYFPRIVSLAIKSGEYDFSIKLVEEIKKSFDFLKKGLIDNNVENNLSICLDIALEYEIDIIYEGICASINPNENTANKKLRNLIQLVKSDALGESTLENAKMLFHSDLHQIPYKEAFLDPDRHSRINYNYHSLDYFEELFINDELLPNYEAFSRFSSLMIEKQNIDDNIKNNFKPFAFYFYTRPFNLLELSLLIKNWNYEEGDFSSYCKLFDISVDDNFNNNCNPSKNLSNPKKEFYTVSLDSTNKDINRVIAFTSLETKEGSWVSVVRDGGDEPDATRYTRILDLTKQIILCKKKIDYVVFPELSIPRKLLLYISEVFRKKNISLIAGIEYKNTPKPVGWPDSINGIVSNQLIYILCIPAKFGIQQIAIIQEKIIPAQKEEAELFNVGGKILQASNQSKYLINHGNFWFSGLICNDLLDINNRGYLRGLIDALIVVEWNPDTETYDSLVTSSANDLHTFIVQVNNRKYGDTRLRGPYKEHYQRDRVRVRGGELDYFVISTLEVEELRKFQRNHRSPEKPFKPVPTGFEMSDDRRKK
jgi:hypothetical protein